MNKHEDQREAQRLRELRADITRTSPAHRDPDFAVTERVAQVPEWLGHLQAALERLEKNAHRLVERINPVLAPFPVGAPGEAERDPALVPVAEQLRSLTRTAVRTADLVESAVNHVQL